MKTTKKKTVFVGMSGGVDSSVAALLLQRQGYVVIGVFMRCWSQKSSDAFGVGADCTAEADATDARRVAGHLGIPFYVWDFEEEYKKQVVDYMIREYKAGLTPNPDVMCNREIKFGIFYRRARAMGADYVATGHYIRLRNTKRYEYTKTRRADGKLSYIRKKFVFRSLVQAKDKNKDQSYFLWTLTQDQIAHSLFPIGDYLKSKVREIAQKAKLPTANKKDSQGICFLGNINVADFLKQHIRMKKGDVVNTSGEKIGTHDGAYFYTIGQRHGLRLGARKSQMANRKPQSGFEPFYVSGKSVKTNTITVAEGDNNPALYQKSIRLTNVNFISGSYSNVLKNIRVRKNKIKVLARVRYRQTLAPAVLSKLKASARGGSASGGQSYKLEFNQPVKFVAPGQSAVFYSEKGEMLGGGVIS